MLSPTIVKIINILPDALLIKVIKRTISGYLKKHARLDVQGIENIDKAKGAKIFICNHLSNADGLVLDKLLKEKYDPTFVAGVKLSNDPVTRLGTEIIKHINIKPNSADKEALTKMVAVVKEGGNLLLFPEGTRSRSQQMIEGKKGVLLIARLTKAEIVPIGMWGTEKLLPISEEGNMASEKFNDADVHVRFGEPITLPKKLEGESKHEFEARSMNHVMKSIANLLPENYRGIYK
ncbi:lysophospholipid acyltransferase family protein [Clostridium chauvoei]|uniref:1-acyl-sn-glycerol-3-phosphate acyltransferase n=2 Tax=Clostridium chauvoei TaxID=46867 RepID=A0ABD4RFS3_9CLOT|nr:lysophospholipid acyltransferase family protein [Clostridium chauvoei]ATD55811.1 1-acyl-sn-glycerol-3-phosphate acyltransferase [Clostridium chauvoei]ATD56515.1 1-acyl-sn-glycerol-3-phosphate acyltransferase [Clostridium chauvoei]MBX7280169.1 1-acyl-sn-glycerol-3-phosphate acyltransferase [Clostridium chauvoei]MBX7282721.1 1-acyl-sn-glycerol-3-phosphate acyltransferase [Clostridium chauvoei]MBX7285060.1 1-acyl-sn-glycerol-3-phosphate acyltransferase [Clostridium chauvoei]